MYYWMLRNMLFYIYYGIMNVYLILNLLHHSPVS